MWTLQHRQPTQQSHHRSMASWENTVLLPAGGMLAWIFF